MVWDAVEATDFSDNSALRAIHMNTLVESMYRLAPNYLRGVGDMVVGRGEGEFQRLEAPTQGGLYLVNDKGVTNLPVWRSLDDVLLKDEDLSADLFGRHFVVSTVLVSRPFRRLRQNYRRTGTATWVKEGRDSENYQSPLVSVHTTPPGNDIMRVSHDTINDVIRLYCNTTSEVTMLVGQNSDSVSSLQASFPRYSDIGLVETGNTQLQTFEVAGTGLSTAAPGFELIDVSFFHREDYYGDLPAYVYAVIFYRY